MKRIIFALFLLFASSAYAVTNANLPVFDWNTASASAAMVQGKQYKYALTASLTASSFTGTTEGGVITVLLTACSGTHTFTFPASKRTGDTNATDTVMTPTAGNHLVEFVYVGGSWYYNTTAVDALYGVLTVPGSLIRTPATISVVAGAGTIAVTSGYSQATIITTTTLTPSAVGTAGQFLLLDIINSTAIIYVVTVDTAVDFTITAMPGRTTTALLRSDGSGWILVGGDPSKVEKIATFSVDGGGSAITTGTISGTSTLPAAYMLTAYSISATANSGTITVNIWRLATATTLPVVGGILNTSGVTLVTNTNVKSAVLTDFAVPTAAAAQTFAAFDELRCAYTVTGNATDLTVTLFGIRL